MRIAVAIIALASLVTAACDTLPKPGTRSYLSVATQAQPPNGPIRTVGTLFVWNNDVNAGVIYEGGNICMQRAMTARAASGSLNASAQAEAPANVLASMTAAAAEANESGNAEASAAMSAAIAQTATALSATSERTAFLDIGMFYICQLSANGRFTAAETNSLSLQLIQSAAGMTPTGSVPQAHAPQYQDTGER
ncbi:MAG: hypothetical protein EON86_10180 [Brevundimonas sp.]|nr:MAG: hypothetical protein EON86_10180 [Brevundimonas sp.]